MLGNGRTFAKERNFIQLFFIENSKVAKLLCAKWKPFATNKLPKVMMAFIYVDAGNKSICNKDDYVAQTVFQGKI